MLEADLTERERKLLIEGIEEILDIEGQQLEEIIAEDPMPETVEEFLGVVATQQERIEELTTLHDKLKGA